VSLDCAVVGLGAMGSATLWRLARRGARVAGVDRFAPPHDRGSSHGESRIIRSAYFEDPAYLPLVRRAFALWRELEAETGETVLTLTGAAMIGPADSPLLNGSLRTAQVHHLDHELLDGKHARQALPQHRLDEGDVALVERDGGVLSPEGGVAAMLRAARQHGAQVMTGRTVERITPRLAGGVRVHLAGADPIDARHAVICAGPWTQRLLPDLPVPLRVERQVAAWFPVEDPAPFRPHAFPVFIRWLAGDRYVYGFPTLDGATLKLAVHHEGTLVDDPDAVPRAITEPDLQPLRDYAASRLRGVESNPVRAITCMYTNTPDEHFVIDAVPDLPGATLVSACSGHGFKFAPAVGEAAADLALDGATAAPVAPFSLRRFAAT